MSAFADIRNFVPLKTVVSGAAVDTHADFGMVERKYNHWAARGLEKLTQETLKSGKRYAILTVNPNLHNATLPCDFKDDLFVGFIDDCGEKVPLSINPNIINEKFTEVIPCDIECEAKCACCYPKQLCSDLTTTQVINIIDISGQDYEETVTSTLLPTGEYYEVITTPIYNTQTSAVEYKTDKRYVTKFDTEACGCIKSTEENALLLKANCPDAWCCYCTSCSKDCSYKGGYKIFWENGLIQFDRSMAYDKVYLEYRGTLPKKNNQYMVPEVAVEALISWVKFKEVENNKSFPMNEKQWRWQRFLTERGNMEKILGRVKLSTIMQAMLITPKFSYHR